MSAFTNHCNGDLCGESKHGHTNTGNCVVRIWTVFCRVNNISSSKDAFADFIKDERNKRGALNFKMERMVNDGVDYGLENRRVILSDILLRFGDYNKTLMAYSEPNLFLLNNEQLRAL